jgi:hypothetical protein
MEFENLTRIMKPACGVAMAPSIIHMYFSNCIIGPTDVQVILLIYIISNPPANLFQIKKC